MRMMYAYQNPKGEIFTSTIRETVLDAMRAYLSVSSQVPNEVVHDCFQSAKARGGKIVEVEIVAMRVME